MVCQHTKLTEWKKTGRVALTSRPPGEPHIQPESSFLVNNQNKNLDGSPWLLRGVLELDDDDLHELLLSWNATAKLRGTLTKTHRKKRVPGIIFARLGQSKTNTNTLQDVRLYTTKKQATSARISYLDIKKRNTALDTPII